jgi:hypothetical protein
MIDPANVRLFIPPDLKGFKQKLFERIGSKLGGVIRGDFAKVRELPDDLIPAVGCTPELTPIIADWRARKREFIYWDRGYARRVFATWHRNAYQLRSIRDVPGDRWKALQTPLMPWRRDGRHIVVAQPTPTYARFHGIEGWTDKTLDALALATDRQIVIRGKESKRPLQADLDGAHALVSHASNAAVEAVICGCPVFVHSDSAAALVGQTDLAKIESPVYPDRDPWVRALAYSQFNERELIDGTLWRLIT